MNAWNDVDEWTDEDRKKELDRIREEMGVSLAERGDLAKTAGKLFLDYLVLIEALRECTRRYLDATGRGAYGAPTMENEVRFFERLGENQVIFQHRPKK